MLRLSRLFVAFLLAVVLIGQHIQAPAASAVSCAARVAVLGADMSPGGRFEVQRALAVGPHTLQLNETIADERAAAHGLVPPDLLGSFAVSSALLHPLPAGSGLTVTVSPGIKLETAQAYANALLTAGVADADVAAAAPTSQQTRGATALLGLLRAAPAACLPLSPARQNLAIREIVLTSELALQIGRQQAPMLLYALKNDAVSRALTAPDALAALVTHDAAAQGAAVPAALRPALVSFLRDLVASGAYKYVAAAHPSVASAGLQRVTVRLSAAPHTQPAGPGAAIPAIAGVWHGTAVSADGRGITIQLPGGAHRFALAAAAQVRQNGRVSTASALRAGEAVTITTDAAGNAVRVDAAGAPVAATQPAPSAASNSLNAPAITVLALLLLLALALLPLVVGYARSRQPVMAGMAARARSAFVTRYVRPSAATPARHSSMARRGASAPRPVPAPDDEYDEVEDDTVV